MGKIPISGDRCFFFSVRIYIRLLPLMYFNVLNVKRFGVRCSKLVVLPPALRLMPRHTTTKFNAMLNLEKVLSQLRNTPGGNLRVFGGLNEFKRCCHAMVVCRLLFCVNLTVLGGSITGRFIISLV